MISKSEEKVLRDNIDYWKKHQELDKHNHQEVLSSFISSLALLISSMIGVATIIFTFVPYPWKNIIIIVLLIIFVIAFLHFKKEFVKKLEDNNESFRIREGMLRVMYRGLGINTDELDTQFKQIKGEVKKGMSNKIIEDIAKRIMDKEE